MTSNSRRIKNKTAVVLANKRIRRFVKICRQLQLLIFIGGDEFNKVLNFAVHNRADSCKNIGVKPRDFVFAIVVYLRSLHFCFVASFVFAHARFLEKLVKLYPYFSIFVHKITHFSIDKSIIYNI